MGKLAFGIEPDFTADVAPFLAKAKVLADVGAGFLVDHAIEKRVAFGGFGVGMGMHAFVAAFRVGRDHAFDHLPL